MAVPTYGNEGGGDKVLCLTDAGEAAKYLAAIEASNSPAGYGWMGIATHTEGDAVLSPGGLTVTAMPLVMVGGDDGANAKPLQVDGSGYLKVALQAGTAAIGKLAANSGVDIGDVDVTSLPSLPAGTNAIGKLAANSGVDIGDVDVTSLPAGNIGQQAMAASLSVVPANNITDPTYIGDIKFGESLPAGTAAIGKLAANSGVDIGDVDVTSVIPGTGATNLGKAIDGAAGATDTGVAPLAIRDDALSALTPIEGDWTPLRVNSTGALHVTGGGGGTEYAVDDALGATPTGTLVLAIRDDALSALTPVQGDAIGLRVDANGALWTHDDVLDAVVSGSEVQVDVVASLPAGTNAIGKLAANSGVDIGDVDVLSLPTGQDTMANSTPVVLANNHGDIKVTLDSEAVVLGAGSAAIGKLAANSGVDIGDVDVASVPAPLNVVGGGTEAAALRVTLANDSTGLVSVDDNGNSLTVDGNVGDDGPGWTPVRKYLSKNTTAAATVWNPTLARLYITDIIISISGTAVDVTLAFGAGTAMTDTLMVFRGDVRGGLTHQFRTPGKSGTDAHNLNITLSAAQQIDITVLGYEKAT
jgi:hypothetical protein